MRISSLQQLFPAVISEHANQRIVDFDEAAVRRGEKQSLLNVVEEFAIAALRFAAIGDVFEHMDGLHAFAAGAVNPRSRNQVSALQHRMDVFVRASPVLGKMDRSAEAAPLPMASKRAHVDPDEFMRSARR